MPEENHQTKHADHAKHTHSRKNAAMYIAAAAVVVAIGLAYLLVFSKGTGTGGSARSPTTTITSDYNASQRTMFYADLAKASSISNLSVSYTSVSNFTQEVAASPNVILLETGSQNINSYEMGNSFKSVLYNQVVYKGVTNHTMTMKNTTTIYYYKLPNSTITCVNQSTYVPTGLKNSSISCITGNGGLAYFSAFPFTLDNISSINGIGNYNITYLGMGKIDSRSCSAFATKLPAQAPFVNFSTVSLCLDSKYGIPTYFNDSDITKGVATSVQSLLAVNISSSVNASEFVIPASYLASAASESGKQKAP